MTAAATTSLPQPLAFDGVVVNDPAGWSLIVKPEQTSGYAALLWTVGESLSVGRRSPVMRLSFRDVHSELRISLTVGCSISVRELVD